MKLFDRISAGSATFTKGEQALVDYLISHHPHGILDSATAIAKNIGVSPSTVVRFFSKLGYSSFAELQREIRSEISSKLASPSQRVDIAVRQEHTLEAVIDNAFLYDKDNINSTRESLDLADVEAIVRILTKPGAAGRIFIVGEKNSYAVAHYLHTHLNMCMRNVQILDTRQSLLADNLLWITESDVLFAISIRRYSKAVMQAASYFKQIGARVLSITDSPLAPIAGLSDYRMLIRTASASPFDSYTAAFCLCNALISAIAIRKKKEVETLLKRGDEIWNHFDTFLKKG
jgi:DNA-binding MurR/RpiR family transcriptional regulator